MCQVERVHEAHKRFSYQRHVGGLDSHVSAGADGESHVGTGEGRRIVDTVADHRHGIALRLQSCDFIRLAFRPHSGDDMTFVDTDLACDGTRSGFVVAGKHDDCDSALFKQFNGLTRVGFRHVRDGYDAGEMAVNGCQHRRLALLR